MVQARRGFSARAFCSCVMVCFPGYPAWRNPSITLAMRAFGEDLTRKCKEASLGIAPGVAMQPGFPAGFLKELLARQPMFDGNLGKKKPALRVQADQ